MGINTAIYSETGGSLGIGFAIPASAAHHILDQIIEHGSVQRGWLGLEPQDITPDLAQAFHLKQMDGRDRGAGAAWRAGRQAQPGIVLDRVGDAERGLTAARVRSEDVSAAKTRDASG
ncbi:Serine protease DegQ OS=Castellaniella defragrans OX=75697 GN=HNR28_000243 PE=4 SV=1 [Castellaniella defragrans]